MNLKRNKIQKFFRFLTVIFILFSLFNFYFIFEAQAKEPVSITDQMGNVYNFDFGLANQVSYTISTYNGYQIDSGSLRIKDDNFMVESGDNCVYVSYIDTSNKLKAKILAATYTRGTYAGKEILLDTNIESFTFNQPSFLELHKFGARIGWINEKEEGEYVAFDLWNGKTEQGKLEDYIAQKGGSSASSQPATITGRSVVFVVDSSGSMKGDKISQAKKAVRRETRRLSENDEAALFIFLGCGNVPLVQGFTQNFSLIEKGLDSADATGGSSPIAQSMIVARVYLEQNHHAPKGRLILYSDGGENCNGDPVAAASSIRKSSFDIDFTFVGYNISGDLRRELEEIAKEAGGNYESERVWDASGAQRKTQKDQEKTATAGVASLLAALSSYFASGGGLNSKQMFDSIFGGGGFISNLTASSSLGGGAVPIDSLLSGMGTGGGVPAFDPSFIQRELNQIQRWRGDIANFRDKMNQALERGDVAAAKRWKNNMASYIAELDAKERQLERSGHLSRENKDYSINPNLKTDTDMRDAMHKEFNDFVSTSETVEANRVILINNIGKAEIKFIDSFRDPLNPYHIIPHKDVNTFMGARDDAKTIANQFNNWRDQIASKEDSYQRWQQIVNDYKDREAIRDAAKKIAAELNDLQNKVNE